MLVPIVVADVMATVCIYVRLMLLPMTVADVITTLLPLIVILADVTQQEQDPQNFMACLRYIRKGCHSDQLYLVLGQ